jgi:hypothetical protein
MAFVVSEVFSGVIRAPFAFAQTDTLTPTPCSAGCSLSIPAISGRVLYYVIERLGASGAVVVEEDPQALVVR